MSSSSISRRSDVTLHANPWFIPPHHLSTPRRDKHCTITSIHSSTRHTTHTNTRDVDRRTLHYTDLRLARAITIPPIRFLPFAADLTLTLTPNTSVLHPPHSRHLCPVTRKIFHSIIIHHAHIINSTLRLSLLSYFRSRQVHALQQYPQYPQ